MTRGNDRRSHIMTSKHIQESWLRARLRIAPLLWSCPSFAASILSHGLVVYSTLRCDYKGERTIPTPPEKRKTILARSQSANKKKTSHTKSKRTARREGGVSSLAGSHLARNFHWRAATTTLRVRNVLGKVWKDRVKLDICERVTIVIGISSHAKVWPRNWPFRDAVDNLHEILQVPKQSAWCTNFGLWDLNETLSTHQVTVTRNCNFTVF